MWVRKQQYPCQPICLVPKRRQKAICLPSPQIYTYPCQGVDPEGQFSELVSNTGTDAITYTDGSVTAATRYTYRIKAINEHGVSDRSRWFHIDTAAAPAEQTNGESASPPTRTEPEDGDFADSTATTGLVAVGESIVGRIESAADVDWILVQADPGQWFTLTVTGYGEGDHTALETPYQQAYHQPDGSVMVPEHALNKDLTPCSTDCVHAKVSQGGSRFVAVASRADGNTGSYRLTVTLERVHEGVDGGVDLALDVSDGVDTRGFLRMLTPPGVSRLQSGLEQIVRRHPAAGRRLVPDRPASRTRLPVRAAGNAVRPTAAAAGLRRNHHRLSAFGPHHPRRGLCRGRPLHRGLQARRRPAGHHQLRCRGRPHRRPGDKGAQRQPAQHRTGPAVLAVLRDCRLPPGPVPARRPVDDPLPGRQQPGRHRAGVSQRRICRQGDRPSHRRPVPRLRVPHHAGGGRRGDDRPPRGFHRGEPQHSRQPAGRLEPPVLPRRSHLRMGRLGGRQRELRGPDQGTAGRRVA